MTHIQMIEAIRTGTRAAEVTAFRLARNKRAQLMLESFALTPDAIKNGDAEIIACEAIANAKISSWIGFHG